ncbi:MAG: OB-fold nucleic acid binding domain-containing protein, partial [Halanaerobiales bacterium]
AYALLAYQTAYLKVKYPSEFMAALLSSVMNNLDKVGLYIQEAKEMVIEVLPPDVNESGYEFETIASGNIRFGLKAIKNVGKNAIRSIIKARQSEPYTGLEDFLQRIDPGKVNIKVVESLVKSGAMDGFEQHRSQLLLRYEDLYQKINAGRKEHSKGQRSFFDLFEEKKEFYDSEIEYPDVDELDFGEKLSLEKEYLGIYISGHPLDKWEGKIKALTNINCQQLSEIEEMHQAALAAVIVDYKLHVTRNEKQMAFLTVEDRAASTDIVVFPDLFNNLDFELEEGKEVFITGRYEDDSFIAGNILPLEREFICINIDYQKRKKLNQLSQIMSRNNGYKPVIINIGKDFILTAKKYWLTDEGLTAIIDIMGEKNIVHYQD